MSSIVEPELDLPFTVAEPDRQAVPFVFNAPHAGRVYPRRFLETSRLDPLTLRRSEDAHVDRLFAGVVGLGAPLMTASFPRAYLDVNREPYELDPRMFEGRLPAFANTRSMRVAGGLGTIPRLVGDGQEIYTGKLPAEEALKRIEWLYKPYHRTLRQLLSRTLRQFGTAVLFDCHSMPSSSLVRDEPMRADVVLGDRYGTSCAAAVTDCVEVELRRRGYFVVRNKPYAGGFITEHYGEPATNRHALQIEINRALYMDERTLEPSSDFARLADDLSAVVAALVAVLPAELTPNRIAAE
ncbi:N-formylglutamate amidohydrolase [Chelatococcus sp. SYSU_G07232]|uniref:N-formylglutamate amidohydrolase n=1 Tax=Chelatococcus albus TaxID=3047466 RepID=A0ABT7AGV4_9HYPH|nr:N-formylglutamate amidohydrolase [Chelatococcus sp. SYSU_G07232]MDJ1158305.1 N-formylglutamate amidohydrolase [Chelatococcus sp. SYSU_G07232]